MIRICQYYLSLASTMFSARSQPAHHWLDVFGRVADKGRKRTPPCPFWSFWSSLSAECRAKTWRLRLATAVTSMGQNYSKLGVHVHVDSVDTYMNPVNACKYVNALLPRHTSIVFSAHYEHHFKCDLEGVLVPGSSAQLLPSARGIRIKNRWPDAAKSVSSQLHCWYPIVHMLATFSTVHRKAALLHLPTDAHNLGIILRIDVFTCVSETSIIIYYNNLYRYIIFYNHL